MFVILNEVKNLIKSMDQKTEILRLTPQNDTLTQPRGRRTKKQIFFKELAMMRSMLAFFLAIVVTWSPAPGFAQDAATVTQQGVALGKEGKWDRALREFKKASDLDPGYAPAHFNTGVAFEKLGKTAEAIDSYKKAVEVDPAYIPPRINLAVLYDKSRKYPEAVEEMEKVLEVEPENATAHYFLGYFYCRQKKYELAWEHARKAEQLKHPQAAKLLAELQDQTRKGKTP